MFRFPHVRRVAAAALLLAIAGCGPRNADRGADQQQAATEPLVLDVAPNELARVQGISVGRADAPAVIYEFADFQCPACAQFASFAIPYIKQRHVETGAVRYVHYDFPLPNHPHAFIAARAARCANDQNRFWEYHDVLYEEQRNWSAQEQAQLLQLFVDYSRRVEIDPAAFESCLRSDRHAEDVTKNLMLGRSLGVPGTPTLFLNGRRLELRSLEELDQLIAQETGMGGETAMMDDG
jgi:protein-disulfide isomerase